MLEFQESEPQRSPGGRSSGHACLLENLDQAVAHLFQIILGEAEPVEDHIHAAEGARQRCGDQVGVHLDRPVAQEPASSHAREQELDAVVHLVEEVTR